MQTFLPYKDFHKSASVLDRQRLGKQRVEALQILQVNLKVDANPTEKVAWKYHPAVIMWRNHNTALLEYLENLHKNEYWTKTELSARMRDAERRSIQLVENHMRRITREK